MVRYRRQVEDIKPLQQTVDGIYRGVVEDNEDPLKCGRCRVRVFGIHTEQIKKDLYEGIPTNELPWSEPALGISEGSVSGFGLWSVPLQGSHVFVFFEGGHIMQPRYFASVPGIPSNAPNTEEGFNDPDGIYPNTTSTEPTKPNALSEADYHRLSRGETENTPISYRNSNRDTDVSQADGNTWDEPESAYNAQYPHNTVFATHAGLVIEVDSTSENERYHIFHPSNTFIEVDKDGNVIVKNAKKKYEIVGDDKNIHIMLNHNQTVDGQRTDKVSEDEIRYVGKNKYITIGIDEERSVGGNFTVDIGGSGQMNAGTFTITAGSGDVTLTSGSQIVLNCPNVVIQNGGLTFSGSGGGSVVSPTAVILNSDVEVHLNKHLA